MNARNEFQKQLNYIRALEKKVRRLLLKDEIEKAIKLLKQIINRCRNIGANEKANFLENKLRTFLAESNVKLEGIAEIINIHEETPEQILFYIEALEKKVKRRLLQDKNMEAIEDLNYIIAELRKLKFFEKADLLETTLNQFIMELHTESQVEMLESHKSSPNQYPPSYKPSYSISETKKSLEGSIFQPLSSSSTPPKPVNESSNRPFIIQTSNNQPSELTKSPHPEPKSHATIKDQPLTEEEILLKKLLEIKDKLSKKE